MMIPIGRQLLMALSRRKPEWEYVPEGWEAEQSNPAIKGWNAESVLESYNANWQGFIKNLKGVSPLGISPESKPFLRGNLVFHNIIMSYAYVLMRSAWAKSSITMLDWGGGIGHYYLISQALAPGLGIQYHCKDVPLLIEYARQLLPEVHFYSDDTWLAREYDLVLASGSLHYSQDWIELLRRLARVTKGYLYVTNLPIVENTPSFVFVQRPYSFGYATEYLGWALNRKEFLRYSEESGLELIREFIIGHQPVIHRAPEQNHYRGFLFRPLQST